MPEPHSPTSPSSEGRALEGRRRVLRAGGVALGAAWVAPAVLSGTPAAAGVASPAPCAFVETVNSSTCEPYPGSVNWGGAPPAGAGCGVALVEASFTFNGGPWQLAACFPTSSHQFLFSLASTWQFRIVGVDACGGAVLWTLTSPVFPACPPPGDADPSGATTEPGIETVTDPDGSTRTILRV